MADSRQRRQRLSAMFFVLWPALATLSSAFPQLFVLILMMFSFSFLFFHRFGFRFFLAYSSFSDFFVIVAALGSVAANDMLKWPKRFILPILCRLLASVLLHYYFCLSCSVLFHFSLRLALQFFDFALSSSFRHLFRLFSGAFAGNWIIRLHASLALIPVRQAKGRGQLKYLYNFWPWHLHVLSFKRRRVSFSALFSLWQKF